jgi:hypothetical protein
MWETFMRFIALAAAATILLMPAAIPAQAHDGNMVQHEEFSAAKKKKAPKAKSKVKQEEYMRAVPSR